MTAHFALWLGGVVNRFMNYPTPLNINYSWSCLFFIVNIDAIVVKPQDLHLWFKTFDIITYSVYFILLIVIYVAIKFVRFLYIMRGQLTSFIGSRVKQILCTWFSPFNAAATLVFLLVCHYVWPNSSHIVKDWNIVYMLALYVVIGLLVFSIFKPTARRFKFLVFLQYFTVIALALYIQWDFVMLVWCNLLKYSLDVSSSNWFANSFK